MLERLNRLWRLFATAASFSVFGIGGIVLWALVFPALSLLVRSRQKRARTARWIIQQLFRGYVGLMRGLGVLSYQVQGLEKLDRHGLLILANHPTLIDVVFLISFTARADCVVKAALLRNPFMRGALLAAGFICNNAGPALVDECIASLRSGNNLIIFPEGTRTPADRSPKLQRGAANIAVRGRIDVTPVVIRCHPSTLTKGEPWWRIPPCRPHFRIEVRDDVPVSPLAASCASEALAARRLNELLTNFFSQETLRDFQHANA